VARQFPVTLWLGVTALAAAMAAGCANEVSRTNARYYFITNGPDTAPYYRQVYGPVGDVGRLAAKFTAPGGQRLCFRGSVSKFIPGDLGSEILLFGPGVYPFELRDAADKVTLTGALMVVNIDKTVGLATFGNAPETRLFLADLVKKAHEGALSKGTITFDEKPVIFYWLGNRTQQNVPDRPSLELDFGAIQDLAEVRVNGSRRDDRIAVVEVFDIKQQPTGTVAIDMWVLGIRPEGSTRTIYTEKVHKIEIVLTSGAKYVGYIRNLRANAYTAFVRVPCSIPANLFAEADKGTIAKYTVTAGEAKEPVVEIVFGQDKR